MRVRRRSGLRPAAGAEGNRPGDAVEFNADALRRRLITTNITTARSFMREGGTVEEYQASIAMYFERYTLTGNLIDLSKAVLKAVSLRTWTVEQPS